MLSHFLAHVLTCLRWRSDCDVTERTVNSEARYETRVSESYIDYTTEKIDFLAYLRGGFLRDS